MLRQIRFRLRANRKLLLITAHYTTNPEIRRPRKITSDRRFIDSYQDRVEDHVAQAVDDYHMSDSSP
jgi:hypothetical protein